MAVTIIGFASEKGGVGKTTSTLHIAAYLAQRWPTVVADGDRLHSGRLYARQGKLPFRVVPEQAVGRERDAEWILADSKGGLDDRDLISLAQSCDMIVIPTDPEIMSLDGARQTAEVLEAAGAGKRMVVLLTRVKPGKRLIQARRVLADLDIPTMESAVRYSELYKEASDQGVVVRDLEVRDRRMRELAENCWGDYERVADELLARMGVEA